MFPCTFFVFILFVSAGVFLFGLALLRRGFSTSLRNGDFEFGAWWLA
jgi:hypothetical protein